MWEVFVNHDSWKHWYDSPIVSVEPRWQDGAILSWRNERATIRDFRPLERVTFEWSWGTTVTWRFEQTDSQTDVLVERDLTKSGELADPARIARTQSGWLERLRRHIEEADGASEASQGMGSGIRAEVSIHVAPADVWRLFTNPATWRDWYGGALVSAAWEAGGEMQWAMGPASRILDIEPMKRVRTLSPSGAERTWTFAEAGNATKLTLRDDLSHATILITDRSLAQRELASRVEGLKRLAESTYPVPISQASVDFASSPTESSSVARILVKTVADAAREHKVWKNVQFLAWVGCALALAVCFAMILFGPRDSLLVTVNGQPFEGAEVRVQGKPGHPGEEKGVTDSAGRVQFLPVGRTLEVSVLTPPDHTCSVSDRRVWWSGRYFTADVRLDETHAATVDFMCRPGNSPAR